MASIVSITPWQGIQVAGTAPATVTQALYQAVDISDVDVLDVEVGLTGLAGTTPTFQANLISSMNKDSDDGSWLSHGVFFATVPGAAPAFARLSITTSGNSGLLRYVRWNVVLGGVSGTTTATFWIQGMGRKT